MQGILTQRTRVTHKRCFIQVTFIVVFSYFEDTIFRDVWEDTMKVTF